MIFKKKFYTKEDIEEIKEMVDVRDILEFFGEVEDERGYYRCPNPFHEDKHPSCKYTNCKEFRNCLTCFSCPDLVGDEVNIIDNIKLWKYLTNEHNFIKICDSLIDFYNNNIKNVKKVEKIHKNIIKNKEKEEDNIEEMIKKTLEHSKSIHELHIENKFFLDEYLTKRAIKYEKIKDFLEDSNIEIRHNYYNNINSCIINLNNKLLLQRQIEDYLKDDKKEAHGKFNKGHSTYYYINNGNKELMIFEGIYDFLSYLSIMENNDYKKTDFIILNSCNNSNKLLDKEMNNLKKYDIIGLFLDNDEMGRKTTEKLQNYLEEYTCFMTCYPQLKDWNEDIIKFENNKREYRKFKRYMNKY